MPKIVIREKHVINLGGWLVENRANLPYKDYVIANPFNEPVKIEAPIYSMDDIEAIKKLGLIVEPVLPYENLVEKINKVKRLIGL